MKRQFLVVKIDDFLKFLKSHVKISVFILFASTFLVSVAGLFIPYVYILKITLYGNDTVFYDKKSINDLYLIAISSGFKSYAAEEFYKRGIISSPARYELCVNISRYELPAGFTVIFKGFNKDTVMRMLDIWTNCYIKLLDEIWYENIIDKFQEDLRRLGLKNIILSGISVSSRENELNFQRELMRVESNTISRIIELLYKMKEGNKLSEEDNELLCRAGVLNGKILPYFKISPVNVWFLPWYIYFFVGLSIGFILCITSFLFFSFK